MWSFRNFRERSFDRRPPELSLVIGLWPDQLDLFAGDLLARFEVDQTAVRLAAGSALEDAVTDPPIPVSVGGRTPPLPLMSRVSCVDADHKPSTDGIYK